MLPEDFVKYLHLVRCGLLSGAVLLDNLLFGANKPLVLRLSKSQMRPIVRDGVALSVSVCLSVCRPKKSIEMPFGAEFVAFKQLCIGRG